MRRTFRCPECGATKYTDDPESLGFLCNNHGENKLISMNQVGSEGTSLLERLFEKQVSEIDGDYGS